MTKYKCRRIFLLSGGFGTELEKYHSSLNKDPLWSSSFLLTNPQIVIDVHKKFLDSGAQIISTNTYQATFKNLENSGLDKNQCCGIFNKATRCVKDAIKECNLKEWDGKSSIVNDIIIAGSVGPYGASLCDGSEYTGKYPDIISKEFLRSWHKPKLDALILSGIHVLAFETIPFYPEIEVINELIEELNFLSWVSVTLNSCSKPGNVKISDKTNILQVIKLLSSNPNVIAIGVNCVNPTLANLWLDEMSREFENYPPKHCTIFGKKFVFKYPKPFIIYPNSGENWDSQTNKWVDHPENDKRLINLINKWHNHDGIVILGGCCRIFSQDIALIKKMFFS